MTQTTQLTLIEPYLGFSDTRDLHYAVLEADTRSGTYQNIFQQTTQHTGVGAGFCASAPMSVPLIAGKFYLVVAGWDSTLSYYGGSTPPGPVSFGNWDSGDAYNGQPLPNPIVSPGGTYAYYQRLTTGAGWLSLNAYAGVYVCRGTNAYDVADTNAAELIVQGPPQVQIDSVSQPAQEGIAVTLAGSFTDPNTFESHTAQLDWGDNAQTTPTIVGGSVGGTHAYDDEGTFTVKLTVTDETLKVGTDTLTLVVSNVAPVVYAGVDIVTSAGVPVSLRPFYVDPGLFDTHWAHVYWGDGSDEACSASQYQVHAPPHSYNLAGDYTVRVMVGDNDGGEGEDTLTVHVSGPPPVYTGANKHWMIYDVSEPEAVTGRR